MIIFRPVRGSLRRAMEEAKVFDDVESMKQYICELDEYVFSPEDIVINEKSVANDTRVGWEDSKYVCTKRWGNEYFEHPQCIGICATIFPENK